MSKFFSSKYRRLKPYTPGEQPQDMQYIKLNTNESPFQPSEKARAAAAAAAGGLNLYPYPECRTLTEKIAETAGVKPSEVLVTNGSDEILNFAFMAFCDDSCGAAFPNITYGFYSVFAQLYNLDYKEVPLKNDFSVDISDYFRLGRTVFIANPNAPTGIALRRAEIEEIIRNNPDNVVVVDEAYVDFGAESCVPLIHKYPNLLVTQTFSKSRSMAGARLGFGIACEELIRDRMWEGDVYFLCRENGRDMLLQYSLDEGKNQDAISYCAYYYGLHTFDGGKLNIVENNNTSIYLNWDGTQNGDWGESQQAFAARVNELIDQSEFLIAQQDGELILTSEVQRWYCVSPKTIRVAMDDTTIYIDRKSWDFAEQYPSLKGFEDIGTAGNYFVAFGSLGEKNDLYVVFNFVAGTLLKTFPGNNLIWQGDDLSTAVYSYWSDIYALNGTKLAALELASGEEISGLAFAPDGVSIIATVSGKSGERKVTVTREGSA